MIDEKLKEGLDPRAYDWKKIDAEKNPLWRTWICEAHGGYDDIVAVPIPFNEYTRIRINCGCMAPYNESARKLVE